MSPSSGPHGGATNHQFHQLVVRVPPVPSVQKPICTPEISRAEIATGRGGSTRAQNPSPAAPPDSPPPSRAAPLRGVRGSPSPLRGAQGLPPRRPPSATAGSPPAMSSQVPPRSTPPPRLRRSIRVRAGLAQITPLVAARSLLALLDLDSLCCARRSPL